MTREEWAGQLAARAVEADKFAAMAPLAVTLRTVLAELESVDGWPATRPAPDVMLTLEEAAQRLGVPKRWLTDHRQELPFLKTYLPGGTVRVSAAGLSRWLASR